jgi:tetraacyldisaccharide 4'-kinase
MSSTIARIWEGESGWPRTVRTALTPASWLYRLGVAGRNALFDRSLLRVHPAAIPAISIGNLSVGGTGKTPVAAWMAGELVARGARPVIVMRGYGDDEPLVHAALNPGVPVVVNADRVQAIGRAAATGRDVAVLDDAFQHRRVARLEDVVLVSADLWREPWRMLPAGPAREPLAALSRATLVMVTRKASSAQDAEALARHLAGRTATGQVSVVLLAAGPLMEVGGSRERPLTALRNARVLLVSGIGDPASLARQLRSAGAQVESRVFPDHHVYEASDIERLGSDGSKYDMLVCTLKDAVKLGPAWPRGAGPLWYVSQRCEIEAGGLQVDALLDRVLAARPNDKPAAGRQAGA